MKVFEKFMFVIITASVESCQQPCGRKVH